MPSIVTSMAPGSEKVVAVAASGRVGSSGRQYARPQEFSRGPRVPRPRAAGRRPARRLCAARFSYSQRSDPGRHADEIAAPPKTAGAPAINCLQEMLKTTADVRRDAQVVQAQFPDGRRLEAEHHLVTDRHRPDLGR